MVLGKLIELYDVDTSVLWPDDCLAESGISDEMALRVMSECLKELGVKGSDVSRPLGPPKTARALVDIIFSCAQSGQVHEGKLAS
jgi:hypothetical protein